MEGLAPNPVDLDHPVPHGQIHEAVRCIRVSQGPMQISWSP